MSATLSSATPAAPAEKRSKVCSVCGGACESYHLNYGVASCFSCRAFFRRAAVALRKKGSHYTSIVCKGTGSCPIGPEIDKKCRRCRYEQCLKAGMKEEQVMSDEQKKVRFRKRLAEQRDEALVQIETLKDQQKAIKSVQTESMKLKFKRKQKLVVRAKRSDSAASPAEHSSATESDVASLLQELGSDSSPSDETLLSDAVTPEMLDTIFTSAADLSQSLSYPGVLRKTEILQLQHITDTWNRCLAMVEPDAAFLDALLELHSAPFMTIINTLFDDGSELLANHFKTVLNLIQAFATRQPEFWEMDPSQQRQRLVEAAYLFSIYLVSNYARSESGKEQIRWILAGKSVEFSMLPERISLMDFGERFGLAIKDVQEQIYQGPLLPLDANPFVAAILLCQDDLHTQPLACVIQTVLSGTETFSAMALVDSLRQTGQTLQPILDKSLLPFTNTVFTEFDPHEGLRWMEDTFRIRSHVDSISLGEDMIKEFLQLQFDVPLSKSFAGKLVCVFLERIRRIAMSLPGFEEVPIEEQNKVLMEHTLKAVSINLSAMSSCKKKEGFRQIQYFFSSTDMDVLHGKYLDGVPVLSPQKLKAIAHADYRAPDISEEDLKEYSKVAHTKIESSKFLVPVAENDNIRDIMLLLFLFYDDPETSHPLFRWVTNRLQLLLRFQLESTLKMTPEAVKRTFHLANRGANAYAVCFGILYKYMAAGAENVQIQEVQ